MKKRLLFVMLLTVCVVIVTIVFAQVHSEGMIAYWKFDEGSGSVAPDSVNGNHGSIHGATWTTGQVDGALSFDGNDDVSIPYSNDWNTGDELTVESWFNLNSQTYWAPIVGRDGYWCYPRPEYRGWILELYTTSNNIVFNVLQPSVNSPLYAINYGEWYHAVGVYDGNFVRLYINGQEIGTGTPRSGPVAPSYTYGITIGADTGCFGFHVKGLIDEVAIYNKALTACEIKQHYENGLAGKGYTLEDTIETLIINIEDLDLSRGLEKSLISKLENALSSFEKGRANAAKNKLNAFINEVDAQRDKKLTDEQADALVIAVQCIIDNI